MKGSSKVNVETTIDPAFRGISKSQSGFYVWRVESLQLIPVGKDQQGVFYDGDSYIVFAASEYGQHVGPGTKPKEIHGKMEMHIHFWLGQNTSQDESAVAAFKSVELDDFLGGSPVQHREVRGNESPRFRSYFKHQGIRIMLGGVESGLKPVNNNIEPRLFRVKGRRCPILTQMPGVAWEYFNPGDAFIIDTKDVVFVWSGRYANSMEKLQAAKMATQFKEERNALSIVFVDDGKENELTIPEQTLLGYYLELSPLAKRVMVERSEDDAKVENGTRSSLKLYRCSDADGIYKVVEVKTGSLDQSDLVPADSYIIDNGPHHIWVWVGRNASSKERVEAMRNAHGFLKKKNYPSSTRVTRVVDGGEPIEFKVLFTSWRDDERIKSSHTPSIKNGNGNNAKHVPLKIDAAVLHSDLKLAAQEQLLDDGTGTLRIWKVGATSLVELPPKRKNVLYSGESYVLKYSYTHSGRESSILYYWKGEDKVETDRNNLGKLTVNQEPALSDVHVQVRTVQGKEPPHFLASFRGKLIILQGQHEDVFPAVFLLQVRGNHIHNTYAIQQPLHRSSLNSNFVFVLRTDESSYVWCGKGSTGDEREMAKIVAKSICEGELVVLYEGLEKPDFWKHITNEGVYANVRTRKSSSKIASIRLFHCSNASGTFKVEETMNFSQSDLIEEDVMILDVFHTIFIWIGRKANKEEKSKALEFASEYLETDPCKRSPDLPVVLIQQGFEPPLFSGFFPSWDPSFWKMEKTFEDIRRELDEQKPTLQVDLIVADNLPNFNDCEKFPITTLLEKDPEKLPAGIDYQHKEIYLAANAFYDVFGMKYTQFTELPKWKQENLKKSALSTSINIIIGSICEVEWATLSDLCGTS
ncbi:hypothetical protein GE061_009924 [Apolygus lucorum]|uniref:HP domain-containing protein n=1 Tax=Apolygus lucorum TaxID=248454 RepID=A0A8S9Y1V8_APOLU|nr:hypothetical protein GE061_009924 [Apolygus lucorum]